MSRDTHTKPSLHHPYTLAPLVCSPRPKLHHLKKLLRKWNQTAGDLWRLAYVTQENAPQIHRAVTCSFSLPSGRPHSGSELMLPADGDRRWPYRVFVGKTQYGKAISQISPSNVESLKANEGSSL